MKIDPGDCRGFLLYSRIVRLQKEMEMFNGNLKLAVQKKGRLTEKTLQLLRNCGLDIEDYNERLLISSRNFELDLLFLRDDDIPEYVQDGVADIGARRPIISAFCAGARNLTGLRPGPR